MTGLKIVCWVLSILFIACFPMIALSGEVVAALIVLVLGITFCPLTYKLLGKIKVKNKNIPKPDNNSGIIIPLSQPQQTSSNVNAPHISSDVSYAFGDTYDGKTLKYEYEDVKVCVIRGKEPDFSLLKNNVNVTFVEEPENEYDSNAVAIYTGNIKLGYLYKGKLQDMANDYLARYDEILGYISKFNAENKEIYLNMAFYQEETKYYDNSISFKLTANANSDMQENVSFCSEGDEVEFEYDYDKEKYCCLINNNLEIGYAPASKNDFFDSTDDYEASIEEISENDNGKLSVKVVVNYN